MTTPLRRFKFAQWGQALCLASILLGANVSIAQFAASNPDWKESDAPVPPAFDLQRLEFFTVSPNSAMQWGFDPRTVLITGDGIVRYVVVARSPSGVLNVMYEGVRCATGEWKSYARHNTASGWSVIVDPQWKTMYDYQPSRHALRLAQQGLCIGGAPVTDVAEVIRSIRQFGKTVN